jgi:hypothetical protein
MKKKNNTWMLNLMRMCQENTQGPFVQGGVDKGIVTWQDASSEGLLGQSVINSYKSKGDSTIAKFAYQVWMPAVKPKAIIIQNYGGFKRDWVYFTDPSTIEAFLKQGYIIIDLITQDGFDSVDQFIYADRPADLFNTLATNLLFTQDVIAQYPGIPVYQYSASFGGFRIALLNLICSYWGEWGKVFSRSDTLNSFLGGVERPEISGFIAHDGGFDDIPKFLKKVASDVMAAPKNYASSPRLGQKYPFLILHNFDDERVPLFEPLNFMDFLYKSNFANAQLLDFHLTPQGSNWLSQGFSPVWGSLAGHHVPQYKKYNRAYMDVVNDFIARKGISSDLHQKLVRHRFEWASLLENGAPWGEKHNKIRSYLLRDYYARLHDAVADKSVVPSAGGGNINNSKEIGPKGRNDCIIIPFAIGNDCIIIPFSIGNDCRGFIPSDFGSC